MDIKTAHMLIDSTCAFYERDRDSFSDTRKNPWPGWERVVEHLKKRTPLLPQDAKPLLSVLDIGCGNGRLEFFLEEQLSTMGYSKLSATMIDSCEFQEATQLVSQTRNDTVQAKFYNLDVIRSLENESLSLELANAAGEPFAGSFDFCAAFGFMHHIPLKKWRLELLRSLVELTKPDGVVAVSFWQPLFDERLARKARNTTCSGCKELNISLECENGDVLLGWQHDKEAFRYVHHFSNDEIAEYAHYAESLGCTTLDKFSPESGSDRLNTYLVLRRNA